VFGLSKVQAEPTLTGCSAVKRRKYLTIFKGDHLLGVFHSPHLGISSSVGTCQGTSFCGNNEPLCVVRCERTIPASLTAWPTSASQSGREAVDSRSRGQRAVRIAKMRLAAIVSVGPSFPLSTRLEYPLIAMLRV
jgi:hypothetical protein